MEVNNTYTNKDLISQFIARQDMPKPASNPIVEKTLTEDTFVKSEPVEKAEETPAPAEEIEETPALAQEVKDTEKTEEVNEEATPAEEIKEENQIGANVTKKVTVIDKIKNFFKNLFMKLKRNKPIEVTTQNCAGGGTN